MNALLFLLSSIVDVLWWFIIISVVMSWLVAFNVINLHNQFVYGIYTSINGIVEPMLRPIRRLMPDLGGIDLSPILVLILLSFLSVFIRYDLPRYLTGM